jgi:hypothetical protein
MSVDLAEIERRLAKLRREWLAHPEKRPIILLQANALKCAKEMALRRITAEDPKDLFEAAKRIFS